MLNYCNLAITIFIIIKTNVRRYHSSTYKFSIVALSGLHLGNDSRGGKIRFYESKGGNGVKIFVPKHTTSRGVWGHAPQKIFVF